MSRSIRARGQVQKKKAAAGDHVRGRKAGKERVIYPSQAGRGCATFPARGGLKADREKEDGGNVLRKELDYTDGDLKGGLGRRRSERNEKKPERTKKSGRLSSKTRLMLSYDYWRKRHQERASTGKREPARRLGFLQGMVSVNRAKGRLGNGKEGYRRLSRHPRCKRGGKVITRKWGRSEKT